MNPLDTPLDILVVSPHPDDAEISVGGTIIQSLRQGKRVGVVELTNGEPTPRGTIERRKSETELATKTLGLTWRHQLDLPNRSLENNLSARRKLAAIFRLTRPNVILAPFWEDAHPDHVAASALTDAARFWSKLSRSDIPGDPFHPPRIYYFWSIHLRIHPKPAFVVDISDAIDQKMEAVQCFASQLIEGRSQEHPTLIDDIRDRARYWGWTIHSRYGEAFASREELRISDLDHIG
ncbi:bacillithiol biosynthesis deacetylase BshB1 [Thalassoglobus polymorphus]|uniref:1D-myo-inositol 2-acetamido-2-deoxy-alpha-D-glucopyranoside deacetylase n=1 Tax=Thalassoglobus polymorphus TaxID=2527994 RepID=A0A517QUP5_9PLAN|nr:bacillithiol biosynthesis deacetylase BshB1 [Thalassoglobus polymorphus]QDT35345.1 1D-myo-inositol 2-acetamido-2-deoxy-alpha-D-glucopyranoside deacetylase [Thalassoglobus polymorphus]